MTLRRPRHFPLVATLTVVPPDPFELPPLPLLVGNQESVDR